MYLYELSGVELASWNSNAVALKGDGRKGVVGAEAQNRCKLCSLEFPGLAEIFSVDIKLCSIYRE